MFVYSKTTETLGKIQIRNSTTKCQNQKSEHNKRTKNKFRISDLVLPFPRVENGGFNLVQKLAKPLTCVTVA